MEWKNAIVFISSTFNDMHAERDYLIKEVFPELTEWCEDRKIRLTDIDLRWGVTEEESSNSKTIETCLRHVDKSRPFFLCFLGQRRGWIPDFKEDINEETKKRYTSIDELDGRSATEMEIEHALLKPIHIFLNEKEYDCPPTKHSLFFFRDPSYVDEISDSQKLIYTNDSEIEEDKIKLADTELEKTKQKIRDRKQEEDAKDDSDITKTHVLISEYSGEWNSDILLAELSHYEHGEGNGRLTNFKCGGKTLKEVLISQLKEQISLAFPENMGFVKQSDLEKDLNQQEIFCYLNSEGFIKRPEYTQKLNDYVENDSDGICLVTAEAGYGKTMLLAKFATDFYGDYPDKKLYKRFCGASDLSSDIYSLWKSIMAEAKISEDEEFYPKNLDELKRNIPQILHAIADKEDSVIIIDAVNQMPDGVNMLKWFDEIPDNLKLIMSVKEDRKDEIFNSKLQNIKNRSIISGFEILELDDNGKKDLINEYLKNYLKSLDEDQIDVICGFEGSKNPLFLKILLAELRVFGSFDQLKEKITSFGETPVSAFKNVLNRLEKDEEDINADKIAHLIFSLLANARVGLSEAELKTVIMDETNLDDKTVQDAIRLNLRQVRQFMARKEGRHDFFYESFKIAAQEKYADLKIKSNELLASYFKFDGEFGDDYSFNGDLSNEDKDYLRPFNELPYHLDESENYDGLTQVLSSYDFIKNKLELDDIYNLTRDYQFAKNHKFSETEDHPIVLIGRALELSSPILGEHKNQLPAQLWGRMNGIDDEVIERLLMQVDEETSEKWIKSHANALYSPKSSILKRILPEGRKATAAIEVTPEKNIISCNEDGMIDIFDIESNELETLEKGDSKIVKIIPDGNTMLVAHADGTIKKWDMVNRMVIKDDYPKIDVEITDIYLSKTYDKIYASSHKGIFSIDLQTDELIELDIEPKNKNYNRILVPRRNEAILVCDEKEVDGWDVYEMRKAYNRHHQQNDDDDSSTKLDSSEEIRFMGLNKRFLTLISENGQMKFWNTLKNSGGGESIAEERVCSINDKFAQAQTLEDENQIITISDMGVLRVWDIPEPRSPEFTIATNENGMELDIQTGITSPTAIDYYSDAEDKWVVVGNENNDVSIIDLNKKVEEEENVRHAESVFSIKTDDNHMITASNNGEIFTWDVDREECINKFANDFRLNAISYNRQDSKLVLAGVKLEKDGRKINKVVTRDVDEGMWRPAELPEGTDKIDLEVSEDKTGMGEVIDIAQNSSGIIFLEENKLTIDSNEIGLSEVATTLSTKFDSDEVFVGFKDGSVVKYPSEVRFESAISSPVTKIKISGDKLIAGYENGSLEIFALDATHLDSLKGHERAIKGIHVDASQMITVSKDKTLKIWQNNECIYTYFLDIFATSVSVCGGKLIIGDALGNVRFFEF